MDGRKSLYRATRLAVRFGRADLFRLARARDVRDVDERESGMNKMTDDEVTEALKSDTPLNRARRVFSGEMGRFEQATTQYYTPTPVEWRRMEFEAVRKIAAELGVEP